MHRESRIPEQVGCTKRTHTALVTGVSNGIGMEFTKILAQNNYNLVLIDRDRKKIEVLKDNLKNNHSVKTTFLIEDLTDMEAPYKIYTTLLAENIEIDILINNAGIGAFGRFSETDWLHESNILKLNIIALTHLTKLFMKGMIERKYGKILNIASIGAFQAVPLQSVYSASKAYVLSFTEAIANELKGTGVTVTALCPGPTATGFHDAANGNGKGRYIPKKMPTAREVAMHGYNAMMKGKHVSIHGIMNTVLINISRFFPRKLLADLARKKLEGHLKDF